MYETSHDFLVCYRFGKQSDRMLVRILVRPLPLYIHGSCCIALDRIEVVVVFPAVGVLNGWAFLSHFNILHDIFSYEHHWQSYLRFHPARLTTGHDDPRIDSLTRLAG